MVGVELGHRSGKSRRCDDAIGLALCAVFWVMVDGVVILDGSREHHYMGCLNWHRYFVRHEVSFIKNIQ